jgi:energy-coupling factor transport system ATP-binding protein
VIELRGVSFGFADGRGILRPVDLAIEDGSWVAVAGGNGSGKTTLCRLVAGLLRPSSGTVSVDGADPSSAGASPAVGIAFQNPDSQFVTSRVEREILFGMENLALPPREMRTRLDEAAAAFGLGGLLRRNPHTLSGGEKQRLVLAGLHAMAPRHLVLDEPFSFLDDVGRASFLGALRGSIRGGSKTVVWSTLDEEEIALAGRVVFLHGGEVLYDGPPRALCAAVPADILDAAIVRAARETAVLPERSRAVPSAPSPDPPRPGDARAAPEGGRAASPASVEIRGAVFTRGGGFSLPVADLAIRRGETIGIAGPSGSGKTTLLLGCAGLLPPREGSATVLGNRIISRRDAPVGRFAFLFQSPEEGFFAPTVRGEVALARRAFHGDRGVEESVVAALEAAGLSPAAFLDRNPFGLSQGEKRLVAIASVLVIGAELLLLDEPTIFLDGAARARLLDLLVRLRAAGTTIVVASHDTRFLEPLCDRVVALSV